LYVNERRLRKNSSEHGFKKRIYKKAVYLSTLFAITGLVFAMAASLIREHA